MLVTSIGIIVSLNFLHFILLKNLKMIHKISKYSMSIITKKNKTTTFFYFNFQCLFVLGIFFRINILCFISCGQYNGKNGKGEISLRLIRFAKSQSNGVWTTHDCCKDHSTTTNTNDNKNQGAWWMCCWKESKWWTKRQMKCWMHASHDCHVRVVSTNKHLQPPLDSVRLVKTR